MRGEVHQVQLREEACEEEGEEAQAGYMTFIHRLARHPQLERAQSGWEGRVKFPLEVALFSAGFQLMLAFVIPWFRQGAGLSPGIASFLILMGLSWYFGERKP